MITKTIAALAAQLKPPIELRNSDAIQMWRLEKAAELAILSTLERSYKESTNPERYW